MSYTTWDIETTIKTRFKRKANPFIPENWVVTHGWKHKGETGVTEYRFGHQRPGPGWLRPVLKDCKLLVGMNIKFDLLHALQDTDNLLAWMAFVADGGNVWDIQLAEYLLCGMGQRDQMLSLDEIAPRYGGNVKVDEVKVLWEQGISTEDIDPELLSRYLCGGNDEHGQYQLGDVENTEKVALAQIARARECGQLKSILLNMGSLLCTVEMERNGMYVDMERGLALAAELQKAVDILKGQLEAFLPSSMPFKFNWASRFHKSAMIFGGTVKWDAHEYDMADGSTMYKHHYDEALAEYGGDLRAALLVDPSLRRVYSQMDVECCTTQDGREIPVEQAKRENVPVVRYSSGKREGEVKTRKVKMDNPDKPKGRGVKAPYTFPRLTEPKKRWESTEPGVYSTASEVIEELGVRNIPFLKAFSELQSLAKDLSTYYIVTEVDDEGNATSKGMLALVDTYGIIHHSINHTSTITARFSSSNPNLQNIPKGNKSDVKTVFVSRFGKDGKIIQSDFSALEIYVQAILTKCKQLIADLKAGLDMHVLRLSNSPAGEGKTYEELLKLCKGYRDETGAKVDPVKKWDYARTDSKVYSFQAAYGAGDQKISDTTGMEKDRVSQLREADEKRYPEITVYFNRRADEIKRNRKPSGVVIPHPDNPSIICNLGKSFVRTPDGKLYSYMESPSPEYLVKRGTYTSFSPTEIKNYEVQGEGGEWAKAAMWLAIRYFYKHGNFGGLALLVNQVHDALYSDAHNTVAEQAAVALHACMEAASDFMEYWFGWEIPVPVPSDTSWGLSMMDEESIPDIKAKAAPVRAELRTLYMNGYKPTYIH
jgi:DNA polymerase I-like protein with 3'-5' exonuclease and polymerase domains